ncbi:uncharacterized protein LY89DRAFT_780432 [Mollisia scopiformis]|uniref:DUF7099 domain-containing protein n=1 Tax=Mollisia scopiformis TaxID=149040 RepID=A0A194XH22_MOLSC|nr:uncharacterized protein LY89DRAFT_780432 [Mollisia scopiformis]KUJ19505.1 hypothetical protein LY89DRAFT_780432 [Mollisia scopiformis]
MSHQDVAAIWSRLAGRADIDNIVQELIGRYSLDISEQTADRAVLRTTAFTHVVALRAIFDLQRTYLQSPDPSCEARFSLLNPNILLSVIKHLLDVKISAFCAHDGLPEHDAYCSFIGQTLVSGIRALHLQSRRLSLSEYQAVLQKFKLAWNNETLRGVDHFSINLFCQRMLAELSNKVQNHRLSSPACGILRLQDFFQGLYPPNDSHQNVDPFVQTVQTAITTSKSSADWFYCALVLFDISWAVIGAIIQMCMDKQYYKGSGRSDFPRNVVPLTLTPRFKMLNELFKESGPCPPPGELEWAFEQTQTMLCMGLGPTCFEQECSCLEVHQNFVQELRTQYISNEASDSIARHFEKISHIDIEPMLNAFQSTLEARHTILPDASKELTAISQKLTDFTNEWCPEIPKLLAHDTRKTITADDIFIVNCPELHPVPSKVLLPNLEESSFPKFPQTGLASEEIQLLKDIPSRRGCGQCLDQSHSISVRRIEPLSKISAYLQDQLKERRKILRNKADMAMKVSSITRSPPRSGRPLPSRRQESSTSPRTSKSPEHLYELPSINYTLTPIRETDLSPPGLEPISKLRHSAISSVDMRSAVSTTQPKSSSPTITYVGSTSSLSYHSENLSRPTSRTFSPPPFPTTDETTDLPEVVAPVRSKLASPTSPQSIASDASSSIIQSPSRKWLFKSRRGYKGTSKIPSATFFTSGRTLLLWNERGACSYDLQNILSISHRIVTTGDILLAAGGTRKIGVVSKTGPIILLRILQGTDQNLAHETEMEEVPHAMALSSNDHYLALKFGSYVRVFDTTSGSFFHHKLPTVNGRSGPKDHLVTFSTDCLSFAATTRFEPEKVVTYFCECQNPLNGDYVESSAPSGLVGDDGLSSLLYSDKSAFLSTFTEKGYPVYLTLLNSRTSSRVLRDKNQQVGSKIHCAALCATGQNLALFNDRNELFWIDTPFGKERAPTRVGSIKREKSVRREVELAMPNSDEVHLFWIYKGKGVLVTMGRHGGKSKPLELDVDLDHLLESE